MSLTPIGRPRSGRVASRSARSRAALDIERHERADLGVALAMASAQRSMTARGVSAPVSICRTSSSAGRHHDFPSSRAMMRSVRRRAPGMITNAVVAATGQAIA